VSWTLPPPVSARGKILENERPRFRSVRCADSSQGAVFANELSKSFVATVQKSITDKNPDKHAAGNSGYDRNQGFHEGSDGEVLCSEENQEASDKCCHSDVTQEDREQQKPWRCIIKPPWRFLAYCVCQKNHSNKRVAALTVEINTASEGDDFGSGDDEHNYPQCRRDRFLVFSAYPERKCEQRKAESRPDEGVLETLDAKIEA
jgi:hypothetical protein